MMESLVSDILMLTEHYLVGTNDMYQLNHSNMSDVWSSSNWYDMGWPHRANPISYSIARNHSKIPVFLNEVLPLPAPSSEILVY